MSDFFSKAAAMRAAGLLAEAQAIVRELVTAERERGLAAAFHAVGRAAGLSERRIKAHWYGEVHATALTAHEIEGLRAAQEAHMRAELARCEHRLAQLRARLGGQQIADDTCQDFRGLVRTAAAMA